MEGGREREKETEGILRECGLREMRSIAPRRCCMQPVVLSDPARASECTMGCFSGSPKSFPFFDKDFPLPTAHLSSPLLSFHRTRLRWLRRTRLLASLWGTKQVSIKTTSGKCLSPSYKDGARIYCKYYTLSHAHIYRCTRVCVYLSVTEYLWKLHVIIEREMA